MTFTNFSIFFSNNGTKGQTELDLGSSLLRISQTRIILQLLRFSLTSFTCRHALLRKVLWMVPIVSFSPSLYWKPQGIFLLLLLFSHSVMSDSATPWTAACQVSLSFTISQSLPKLMSIELVMPSNHLILCHPLLLLPSILHSIRVFSSEFTLHIR